ncbi:MAG: flagellar basal body rod C-terminal domain-containing protein [Pseudomonadota bacterium]
MNVFKETLSQAMSGMQVQSRRVGVAAENISNADTPGYQRKVLVAEAGATAGDAFRATRVVLDEAPGLKSYEPEHPMADGDGYVTLSNVSLVSEMADMREANRTYEANLNAFQQARTMYQSLLDILRR